MRYFARYIIIVLYCALLMCCSQHDNHSTSTHPADVLNSTARTWQYRNIDSAGHYATMAYDKAGHYTHGRSVACNMLGFVSYVRMDYEEALRWYDQVERQSGCELERFVADVGKMDVYQRVADDLSFYDCRARALKRLSHINEESATFSSAEQERLRQAVNELHLVSALHHYMIGQRPEAHAEMQCVIENDALRADSTQWLMYLYMRGIGLGIEGDTREQRWLHRYTFLNNCLYMSRKAGYAYFEGLALYGLSELMAEPSRTAYIAQHRPRSFAQLVTLAEARSESNKTGEDGSTTDMISDCNSTESCFYAASLGLSLAQRALHCLSAYGDSYGVMNATVQIASLYNRIGEYEQALSLLHGVDGAPDPLAKSHEELSVAYAGLGNKAMSNHHRNLYLDLLETTRQDKEVEIRYLSLQRRGRTVKVLLCIVVVGIVLFVILLAVLSYRHRHRGNGYEQLLLEQLQETEKRVYLHHKHIEESKRDNIVRKASLSIVTGMIPYIDRMAHEVKRLQASEVWDDEVLRARKLDYIAELADEINNQNELLSRWVKTVQGMIGLMIESFSLTEVFDMIERSVPTFSMKGITLDVQPTNAVVKADKALTFFMLNTLADNAKKFTPEGGRVTISAEEYSEYVELSVTDNGVGMSANDVECILYDAVYDAAAIGKTLPAGWRERKGSGFGLLNCKGIIEKYRKTDTLFEVCRLGIDSEEGRGSRFWFRLPKGGRRAILLLCIMLSSSVMLADTSYSPILEKAAAFADSVYYANVDGRHSEALIFADSAIHYLNTHHRLYAEKYIDTLSAMHGEPDVEIRWWLSDYATDYHTILDVRNELAVANLALHRLSEYRYNNRIYNDLYKLVSEDRSLIDYCNRMQRYYSNIFVAVFICLLLVVGYLIVIIYSFMGRVATTYCHIESIEDDERRARHEENRLHVQNLVLDNCLSALKHETIYYPNRIKQLVNHLSGQTERRQMYELIAYYRVTFSTLAGCASRQLEEVTFRRSAVVADVLLHRAANYHAKRYGNHSGVPELAVNSCGSIVLCDETLADFLIEQLIDASLSLSVTDKLELVASPDGGFVRIALTNNSRTLDEEKLQKLFYPSLSSIVSTDECLQGIEYIVCRQIIREHDDYFGHIGCRIKAEKVEAGYTVWFTLPRQTENL